MATPLFPPSTVANPVLPIYAEMYVNGDWVDFAANGDILQRANISITRGVADETATITPASQCTVTLDNKPHAGETSGRYDPSDPGGLYYGSIGRNTPVRVGIGAEVDTFTRTVAAGSWGTNDSGDTYSYIASGANTTSAFAVAAGVGTHTVLHTTAASVSALTTNAFYGDVDVAVTVTVLSGTTVTGGQVEPANIIVRATDTTHYYLFRVTIQPSGAVTGQWIDIASGTSLSSVVTATVTHSAASLRVRAQVEGQTLRGKIWDASGAEPAGWLVTANYMDVVSTNNNVVALDVPGPVGVRSGVSSGNTNASPVVFSYDNLVVRVPRYAGWFASLVPSTDGSGQDKYVSGTVASVLRQLGQGSLAQQSTLRHDIPTLATLVAYWPCEDAVGASSFASAFPGGQPMFVQSGTQPQLASDSTFVGSAALPVNNGSYWIGKVNSYTPTGTAQVRALIKFPPAATLLDQTVLLRMHTTGTVIRWDVYYGAGGSLGVRAWDNTGTQVVDTGPVGFSADGANVRIALSVTPSGGNLSCQLSTLAQGVNAAAGYFAFTVTGQSITNCYAVAIGPPGNNLATTVVGQVTVESSATDIFSLLAQFNAFVGETAVARLARLCSYNAIEFGYSGDRWAKPQTMAAQPIDTLLNLLSQCAISDGGVLYEAKGSPALMYRTGGAHTRGPTQAVVCALDRAQHQLSAAPAVTFDDLNLHNDYIYTRQNGSSYEAQQTTGPLSTAPPPNGVGVYQTTQSVSCQSDATLQDLATWALHLGTWPSARIPQLSLNLASTHLTSPTTLWWSVLAIDVDTMISLAGQTPDTTLLLARGYTEQLNAFSYTMTVNCAPGAPYLAPVFDDGTSRFDSDQSFLTASINASVTSLSVTILDGTLWTTAAGDLPLDIMLGGERITVGAVSGASSPQTFSSLTRSVNGVVKGHTHGDQITLFTPTYLALGVT